VEATLLSPFGPFAGGLFKALGKPLCWTQAKSASLKRPLLSFFGPFVGGTLFMLNPLHGKYAIYAI